MAATLASRVDPSIMQEISLNQPFTTPICSCSRVEIALSLQLAISEHKAKEDPYSYLSINLGLCCKTTCDKAQTTNNPASMASRLKAISWTGIEGWQHKLSSLR